MFFRKDFLIMPNLAQSLKAEIQHISRKEIKLSVISIHASSIALKKTVAELKKRIAGLRSWEQAPSLRLRNRFFRNSSQQKVRIIAKSIKTLRDKLGLSQAEFGKLFIGVSKARLADRVGSPDIAVVDINQRPAGEIAIDHHFENVVVEVKPREVPIIVIGLVEEVEAVEALNPTHLDLDVEILGSTPRK